MKYAVLFLFALSLSGYSQIIAGDSTGSLIFYKDLNVLSVPAALQQQHESCSIDLDLDGIGDVAISQDVTRSPGSSGYSETFNILDAKVAALMDTTIIPLSYAANAGSIINRSWKPYAGACLFSYYIYGGATHEAGSFDQFSRLLALRMIIESDTLYGWIRLRLQGQSPDFTGIVAYSYAFFDPTGKIKDNRTLRPLSVFPIPADRYIVVHNEIPVNEIWIYTSVGNLSTHSFDSPVDVSALPSGLYMVRGRCGEQYQTGKFLIQH